MKLVYTLLYMMTKAARFIFLILCVTWRPNAFAAYTNYSSIMLGDRAGGMGGAFTALTGDTAASAYYNPATLARLEGSSLSTAVSLFNKYDVTFGSQNTLDEALFRINKGSILSIPAASGIFSSFRSFSAGLSIVLPDYQVFGGELESPSGDTAFLRVDDQSLWVGGALGFNISEEKALGISVYYTSHTSTRSLTNRYDDGGETVVLNEERTLTSNSFVYILGYYQELSNNWRFGASYRFRSIQVDGKGSYLQSQVGTVSGAQPLVRNNRLSAETRVPDKLTFGFAYVKPEDQTVSLDISYFGENRYRDLDTYGDIIECEQVINAALGYEKFLKPWLALRMGLFTDLSSTPEIPANPGRRFQDHIDKYGFSANLGIHTTEHTTISLGGYYLGGDGHTTENIGPNLQRVTKSERLFSLLVGSSYSF
jgi:hypothetical protein